MKIQVLSPQVAQLIAAGEVVERPSSVVKEMLENAIDAGATLITVEIKQGGITYIRMTDNGCGILREDVPNVFVSHATSKLRTADDLNDIGTLGFRGEAMASIAGVSRVELLTRSAEEETGSRYEIHGGQFVSLDEAGCPMGTTIVVRDLFYNTPARMKFLKKDVSEGNAVAGVVDRIALSHPEISFRFIRDGKQTLLTPGDGKLFSAIFSVFGKPFASGMIPVDYTLNGIGVTGYVCKPLYARANRSMQFFFVNGRLVKTNTCMAALEQAYKNSIMVGKFPSCVLFLKLPLSQVDVNVHPAKIEVRFAQEKAVFDAAYYACKNAINQGDTPAQAVLKPPVTASDFQKKPAPPEQTVLREKTVSSPSEQWIQRHSVPAPAQTGRPDSVVAASLGQVYTQAFSGQAPEPALQRRAAPVPSGIPLHQDEEVARESHPIERTPDSPPESDGENPAQEETAKPQEVLHVLGEAFQTYILVQGEKSLYIIDKHAAHERMLFEALQKEDHTQGQLLLAPLPITFSKEEYSCVLENLDLFEKSGFRIEDFGDGSILVRECPMILAQADIQDSIVEIVGHLLANRKEMLTEQMDWIYHSVACRGAIKAGNFTSQFEREKFVETLFSMPDIRYCPHGRPVLVEMTRYELEKQFGRISS